MIEIADEVQASMAITIGQVVADPSASSWLKQSLMTALQRDPVDAVNDAEVLLSLLKQQVESVPRKTNESL